MFSCQGFLAAADSRREGNNDIIKKQMGSCPKKQQLTVAFKEESARNQGYRYNPSGIPLLEETIHGCPMVDIERPSGPRTYYTLTSKATGLIVQADLWKGTEVTKAVEVSILGATTFIQPRERLGH